MKVAALVCLLFVPLMARAQATASPAPAATTTTTFAMTASALALPGNHQTVSGSVSGIMFSPTSKFDFREDNLVPAVPGQLAFFGGFNYHLPPISTAIQNGTNLNGFNFDFYLTGSLGVTRITDSSNNTASHYAGLAGVGVNYKLSKGGTWAMGFEARAARLPGMASGWTAVISLGPSIHF